jgi:hypothetical protein
MRYTTFLILGFLWGCSGAPETVLEPSEEKVEQEKIVVPRANEQTGSGPCSQTNRRTQVIVTGTKTEITIVIPSMCNDRWVDLGYPTP